MPNDRRRDLLIGKIWLQAIVIVGLLGFTLLGILAYRTYTDEPPIPVPTENSVVIDPVEFASICR